VPQDTEDLRIAGNLSARPSAGSALLLSQPEQRRGQPPLQTARRSGTRSPAGNPPHATRTSAASCATGWRS